MCCGAGKIYIYIYLPKLISIPTVCLDQKLEPLHPSIKVVVTELWQPGKNVLGENQMGYKCFSLVHRDVEMPLKSE